MGYLTIEEANVTTIDQARDTDPVVVALSLMGEDILTLAAGITTEEVKEVGRVFEDARGDLWFALRPDYIVSSNAVNRAAQVSDSALDVARWAF